MKLRLLLLPAVALFCLEGCVIKRTVFHDAPPPKTKKSNLDSKPECHPSQYWDGKQCRHKGKGKGARKYDD